MEMDEDTKVLSDFIDSKTLQLAPYPEVVSKAMNTIVGQSVPHRLKLGVALSELITLASHLRKPIILFDGTMVPVNAISVILSPSGSSKDKSMNAVRKALGGSYKKLEQYRKKDAVEKARALANANNDNPSNYEKYYSPPIPLQAGLGTPEGITKHLAVLSTSTFGAGSLSCSEIATEMQNNGNFTEIVKILSVGYDLGDIPIKVIKSNENQTSAVIGLPINGLLFGSYDTILYQQDLKSKFKGLFNSQLARRTMFGFTPTTPVRDTVKSIDELYEIRNKEREQVVRAQKELSDLTDNLIENTNHKPMPLTDKAQKLYDVYQELNSIRSDRGSNLYPIAKLSRKHKQWLAMKVAGAYSILASEEAITEECYAYAINTVELMSGDLKQFELELAKDQHENLAGYCKLHANDGVTFISLHDMRKLGYISGTGASKSKIDEVIALANSYDKNGSYTPKDSGIKYTALVKTKSVGISYLMFETALTDKKFKEFARDKCSTGYSFEEEMEFKDLAELLETNAVYGPFKFNEGIRHKDNVVGATGLLVMDVDEASMTDEEVHLLLDNYQHYVVRTSDPDNAYKYRVIMPLDIELDVDDDVYKMFIQCAAEELGLVVDKLPKSQIFFSFQGRNILSQMKGEKLPVKHLLTAATAKIASKDSKPPRELPEASKKALLDDPLVTFWYAYEIKGVGTRNNCIYRALQHAIDLGGTKDYVYDLGEAINQYITCPLSTEKLHAELITPAIRKM